jgi:hypothetical protein
MTLINESSKLIPRSFTRYVALTLLVGGSVGCGSGSLSSPDGNPGAASSAALQAQLAAAATTWASFKGSCPTYSYDRRYQSVTGSAQSTQVEITPGGASLRRFSTYAPSAGGGGTWTLVWEEGGSAVGSHDGAYPAYAVEQLQAECGTGLMQDPATWDLTLQIDASTGVPTLCLQRPIGCADDCTLGIRIAAFACTPLSANGPS